MTFKLVDVEELIAQAKMSGVSKISVDVPLLASYSQEACISQTQWMAGPHFNKNYAWLHVDAEGVPFYAGYGRGAFAWQKNGGVAWEWFVRERLGGEYRVVVLAVGMSEAHAQSIFEQMLETYNKRLLNQSSFNRGMDYAALKEENDKKDAIRPYYPIVRSKKPAAMIFQAALTAQNMQYALNPYRTETGRFGEVLRDMDAYQPINTSFITFIVEWHIGQDDLDGAREALAEFKRRAPRHNGHDRITRLDKLVEHGPFYRRPGWLDIT
ncbi:MULTISPECIES: hypothetical protein [Xanthomonas]|uniref:hypothetical protein n=1 Tax=Xanthomonas TaxID=338 RepID=UPI0005945FC3|nr:hypothetical protein [Xanthomonas campestris]MCC5043008.1 hypothetical protein [Xanthomonas campestris]MEB1183802.1 hypothetical protein [Xanthomonas campestris pv. campestris]MEB2019213.1 hypothetical protein [Xanthomonas campestris pv. campestris]UKA42864.1 hypothetical protein JOA57_11465 [Xanthomonas campestris pv. campestris]